MSELKHNESSAVSPFVVQSSGDVGQTIVDANDRVVCWTTDWWIAEVIATMLTEHASWL